MVTTLRRCAECRLLFRAPTTTVVENRHLYQRKYKEGFTTDCPSDEVLAELVRSNFQNHRKSYAGYIALLDALGASGGQRLFDFGCSWGYGAFQLAKCGFDVCAYEISEPRARYAEEKLDVAMSTPEQEADASFDVFFSSHVIEHVPSVREMIATGLRLLRPGGLFVAFTPNASASHRAVDEAGWHHVWGYVHPQVIDDVFLAAFDARLPYIALSSPYPLQAAKDWDDSSRLIGEMRGSELCVAFRKPVDVGTEEIAHPLR
ncbi:MAG: class I SAM-dependent methyltransferase [Gemmatimonadaceae bacterium]